MRKREVCLGNVELLNCASKSWGRIERKRGKQTVDNLMAQVYEIDLVIELLERRN
jgi:hypothetical protein